jgi:hypothetical protein
VRADARLDTLDTFFRNTWLKCCGHMSRFCINGEDYVSGAARELGARSMNIPLDKVLTPRITCTYQYDFGTTTALKLRVLAERLGARQREAAQVLARNNPPVFPYVVCGQEEMCLPVVNSARVDMCGYTG